MVKAVKDHFDKQNSLAMQTQFMLDKVIKGEGNEDAPSKAPTYDKTRKEKKKRPRIQNATHSVKSKRPPNDIKKNRKKGRTHKPSN